MGRRDKKPEISAWFDTRHNFWKARLSIDGSTIETGGETEEEAIKSAWRAAASAARDDDPGPFLDLINSVSDGKRDVRWAEIQDISAVVMGTTEPWTRLKLLERLFELEESTLLDDLPYHYYQPRKVLARDLAHGYLQTNQWKKAEECAVKAERPDLAALALIAAGDLGGGFSYLEQSDFSFSKPRARRIGLLLSEYFKCEPQMEVVAAMWPSVARRLEERFGTWNTFLYEIEHGTPEEWVPVTPPMVEPPEIGTEAWLALLAQGRELVSREAAERDALESCRRLAKSGEFTKAELCARKIIDSESRFQSEANDLLLPLLLVQGKWEELLAKLEGSYLGTERDFYLNLKIVLGREFSGADLVNNFFYLIERRSALFEKAPFYYESEASARLSAYVRSHGVDPFRRFASREKGSDAEYNWQHHQLGEIGRLPQSISKRFSTFWFFCNSKTVENDLRDILSDLEQVVRKRVGAIGSGERWISERSLAKAVSERFAGMKVLRQKSPSWLLPQHLDIYIPDLSLAIEYMGRQHYEAVEFFGGEEALRNTQARDARKRELCNLNNIRLLYVRYDDDWAEFLEGLDRIAKARRAH